MKDSAPPPEDDQGKQSPFSGAGSGKRPLLETSGELLRGGTCRGCHDKDPEPAACSPQPQEEVSSLLEKEARRGKPSISAGPGKLRKPNTTGLA